MGTRLLLGEPVAQNLYKKTQKYITDHQISGYLAIFMMGENNPSRVYVHKKIAYAEKLGLEGKVFSYTHSRIDEILADIQSCNEDKTCLGIIIQLPLPENLQQYKVQLLNAVAPEKDVDCLGEKLLAISQLGTNELQVAPATPAATLHLLDYYSCFHKEYTIAVLGESDLIGKPLTQLLKNRGAKVQSFNEFSDQNQMRSICQSSDMIIAATGKLHLVDEQFVRDDKTQIVIDVGRGTIDGRPTGDVNFDLVGDKVAAYTPVPGGIGPVTVASIFWNMCLLLDWK